MNKADITHNIQMKTKDVLIYVLNFMVDSIEGMGNDYNSNLFIYLFIHSFIQNSDNTCEQCNIDIHISHPTK